MTTLPLISANLRMSCPLLILVIHHAIRGQLEFRQKLTSSFIYETSPSTSSSSSLSPPAGKDPSIIELEKLLVQSTDVLLYSCRAQVGMMKVSVARIGHTASH